MIANGVFVWLKNDQDPPVFWPVGTVQSATEIRNAQQDAISNSWIFLGNYEVIRCVMR